METPSAQKLGNHIGIVETCFQSANAFHVVKPGILLENFLYSRINYFRLYLDQSFLFGRVATMFLLLLFSDHKKNKKRQENLPYNLQDIRDFDDTIYMTAKTKSLFFPKCSPDFRPTIDQLLDTVYNLCHDTPLVKPTFPSFLLIGNRCPSEFDFLLAEEKPNIRTDYKWNQKTMQVEKIKNGASAKPQLLVHSTPSPISDLRHEDWENLVTQKNADNVGACCWNTPSKMAKNQFNIYLFLSNQFFSSAIQHTFYDIDPHHKATSTFAKWCDSPSEIFCQLHCEKFKSYLHRLKRPMILMGWMNLLGFVAASSPKLWKLLGVENDGTVASRCRLLRAFYQECLVRHPSKKPLPVEHQPEIVSDTLSTLFLPDINHVHLMYSTFHVKNSRTAGMLGPKKILKNKLCGLNPDYATMYEGLRFKTMSSRKKSDEIFLKHFFNPTF